MSASPDRYIATVADARGRDLYVTAPFQTREAAAAVAFAAKPRARKCSTCRVTPSGQRAHLDIRWHERGRT